MNIIKAAQTTVRKIFFPLVGGLFLSNTGFAEDIDLFASGFSSSEATSALPNVLFVIDNKSNWAGSNQKLTKKNADGEDEIINTGEAELLAIETSIDALLESTDNARGINVGVMWYVTGNSSYEGGQVVFDLAPITEKCPLSEDCNYARLMSTLSGIRANVTANYYKAPSSAGYGSLWWDVYNYLAGEAQSQGGGGTEGDLDRLATDPAAYTDTTFGTFNSPLGEDGICSETYVIFLSNPQGTPTADGSNSDTTNSNALISLYASVDASPAGMYGEIPSGAAPLPMRKFTETAAGSTGGPLGFTTQCYQNLQRCGSDFPDASLAEEPLLANEACVNGNCVCSDVEVRTDGCGRNREKYTIVDTTADVSEDVDGYLHVPTGASYGENERSGSLTVRYDLNIDDWARFLYREGVPVTLSDGDQFRMKVTTYTVDVFNSAGDLVNSSQLDSAAREGDGRRFEASNFEDLVEVFTNIFDDIIDVNTAFAAVTLPLSATNRVNAENRVFVGTFRPAQNREPRWQGNLKEYRLAYYTDTDSVELADATLQQAINPETGFARSCAASYMGFDTSEETIFSQGGVTVDDAATASTTTGPYFTNFDNDFTSGGECADPGVNSLSDIPDGPYVEKGGVAQNIRYQATRAIYTDGGINSGSLGVSASDGSSSLSSSANDYMSYLFGDDPGLKGGDCEIQESGVCKQLVDGAATETKLNTPAVGRNPALHGDIIHSRPLTISYGRADNGDSLGFRIFYGANDGLYRAVDPGIGVSTRDNRTASEVWALLSSDHEERIERLYRNTPSIAYRGLPGSLLDAINAESKPYFFDGSTGSFTEYDSQGRLTTGYIFPTMRRGGRLVYGIDVSPVNGTIPTAPEILWVRGCASGVDGDGNSVCSSGWSNVGQTWSTPISGYLPGYESGGSPQPILLMGGGWDECLDPDTSGLDQTADSFQENAINIYGSTASISKASCGSGQGVYVLDAKTGAVIARFATDFPVVAEVTGVDFDNDGVSPPVFDVAYAVDVGGNVYRIDFSEMPERGAGTGLSQPSGLENGLVSPTSTVSDETSVWHIQKIAFSTSAGGAAQDRMMQKPVVAFGFASNKTMLTFGTGDRERPLEVDFPYSAPIQNRFYGLVDRPYSASAAINLRTDSRLIQITDTGESGGTFDFGSADSVGWYVQLGALSGEDRGEQVINPSAVAGNSVFFNTFQPVGGPQSICSNLGLGKSYRVSLFDPSDGFDEDEIDGGGPPIPPIVANVEDIPTVTCSAGSCTEDTGADPKDVFVCIGCDGFDPVEINPSTTGEQSEDYRAENIDGRSDL